MLQLFFAVVATAGSWRSASDCVADPRCYPAHVQVLDLQADVQSNSTFIIQTLFEDVLYVWLVGPELIAAHIHPLGYFDPGRYEFRVSFDVQLRGNYQLHVRVDQVGSERIGFHRELFTSPFHVRAAGSFTEVDVSDRPPCTSVGAASQGSWFHHHYLHGADFTGAIIRTRSDYVWVPHNCRMLPLWDQPALLRRWYAQRICALGDSYLRTLLSSMLYHVGLTAWERLLATEYVKGSWHAANTSFFWHGRGVDQHQQQCFQEADVIIIAFPSTFSRQEAAMHLDIMRAKASKAHYVYMLPHPWSGDLLAVDNQHDNILRNRARKDALSNLPQHVDVFDAWNMTHARHDEACDGSHFMCLSRQIPGQLTPVGLWEGYTLAHAHGLNT